MEAKMYDPRKKCQIMFCAYIIIYVANQKSLNVLLKKTKTFSSLHCNIKYCLTAKTESLK